MPRYRGGQPADDPFTSAVRPVSRDIRQSGAKVTAMACLRADTKLGTRQARGSEPWTVPASVDTRLSCPICRESEKWVRHAAHLRRSTRSSR